MLPRTRERTRAADEAAAFGTLVHHWKETGETSPEWASERDVVCLEKKILASGIQREDWWPEGEGRHEVTFAVNLYTLELREYEGGRGGADEWKKQAAFGPDWLTGTIDWLYTDRTTRCHWVDDLKTGRWPVHADTKQLLSYAIYPWIKYHQVDWTCLLTITQWPRYPLAGLPRRWPGRFITGSHVELHLDDLRWSREHPGETNPTDEWCKFCDSKPVCPEWRL